MNDTLNVGKHVGRPNRQDDFNTIIDSLRVGTRIVIDPCCKGLEICTNGRVLQLEPFLGALRHTHTSNVNVRLDVFLAPVLGRTAPGLTIELQDEIAVAVHLCRTERMKQPFPAIGKYMRDAP